MPNKLENNFVMNYEPEMDETPVLEHYLASWYQSLIGTLMLMVELERVNIITEVPLMAPQMEIPRECHLDDMIHVFYFLHQKYNLRMAFDTTYPGINVKVLKECDWKEFYGDVA